MYQNWSEKLKASIDSIQDEQSFREFLKVNKLEGISFNGHPDSKDSIALNLKTFPSKVSRTCTNNLFDAQLLWEENTSFTEANLVSPTYIHNAGGDILSETIYALYFGNKILEQNTVNQLNFAFSCDANIFHNIIKLRTFRYLWEYTLEQLNLDTNFQIIAYPSLREQSVLDIENNMLRLTTSTMGAILGGADIIQGINYDQLAQNEVNPVAQRQNENCFEILTGESFLAQVKDPANGSYAIEDGCAQLIEAIRTTWGQYKDLEVNDFINAMKELCLDKYNQRILALRENKKFQTGVNLYRGEKSKLQNEFKSSSKHFPIRRWAIDFEEEEK